MRKILLLISTVALLAGVANAQENMMSKRGTPILPEAKDWGLGIDANPILEFFGNAFNNDNNPAPTWGFETNPMVITGLMVKDANTAYRAKLRLGIGSNKVTYPVADNTSTAIPPAKTNDEVKTGSRNIVIGAGIQKNRGKGRLRGIYGAEAMIGLFGSKTEYTYANAFSTNVQAPTTGIPGQIGNFPRTTEDKSGSTFMFGIRGFIGAEYFFAPKMSVAGEFGWGPSLSSTGEGQRQRDSSTPPAILPVFDGRSSTSRHSFRNR